MKTIKVLISITIIADFIRLFFWVLPTLGIVRFEPTDPPFPENGALPWSFIKMGNHRCHFPEHGEKLLVRSSRRTAFLRASQICQYNNAKNKSLRDLLR
jgi:hypothetical protein